MKRIRLANAWVHSRRYRERSSSVAGHPFPARIERLECPLHSRYEEERSRLLLTRTSRESGPKAAKTQERAQGRQGAATKNQGESQRTEFRYRWPVPIRQKAAATKS